MKRRRRKSDSAKKRRAFNRTCEQLGWNEPTITAADLERAAAYAKAQGGFGLQSASAIFGIAMHSSLDRFFMILSTSPLPSGGASGNMKEDQTYLITTTRLFHWLETAFRHGLVASSTKSPTSHRGTADDRRTSREYAKQFIEALERRNEWNKSRSSSSKRPRTSSSSPTPRG